ncbi:MAG TPA: hypothetical protein VJJ82_04790 [Candidatus Nanoarchaeia archaeon]|nr:hypothetical protein [Candidatus Nanoarchaeia archaeon]
MARVRTVDLLSKEKLQEIVLKSITESGWNFQLLNPFGSSPLRLNLTFGDKQEEVAVYIWNVSHGGKTRGKDEFRIQLKGTSLEVGETYKTLLLGWHTEKKVFMAGNAFKHRLFGKSPSIQVKLETLQKAVEHGVAFQTKTSKTGQEIVVTFQSNYIMEYITEIYPQYHPNALIKLPETELKAVENPLDTAIPFEQLNNIPTERRIVVTTINKKVREVKFQKYVYQIYSGKCAMCGL